MEVNDVPQQDCQGVLDQLSQLGKIKILDYFDEPEKYDGSRILYKSHVSLIHIQTGQTITGSSVLVESKSKAKNQAAQDAWFQIQGIEQGIVARSLQLQEGKGEYCVFRYVHDITYTTSIFFWFLYRQCKIISNYYANFKSP